MGIPMYQHCKGWVCVNAQNNVAAILEALKNGAFYSSTGPEIRDFAIEDGVARVACSPCAHIDFLYGGFPSRVVRGDGIETAECKVPEGTRYLRARVVDAQGQRAWTNPIFLAE